NAGTAGRIVSGGDLTLDIDSGRNVNSQVIAGGQLGGHADRLGNEAVTGTKTVKDSGFWHADTVEYSPYVTHIGTAQAFQDTLSTSINLSTAVKESSPASIPGKQIDPAQLGRASASAQGTGAVGSSGRPGTVYEVAAAPDSAGGTPGGTIPTVIRTSAPSTALPRASLFSVRESGTYLVETDPRFANYRQWLSSDYLLRNLGLDPQGTQKRLGDGFYEQKLIREQVAQLTGNRYLEGYSSDEDMYIALMNSGATFAKQFQLTPGVGLSAAQMAQLTSDIVWLVEQAVTLPDGSVQKVLVPQLYVRVKEGDIQGNGALIAGDSVDLKITGNLSNQDGAVIAGRTALKIDAGSIDVLSGARIHGGDVDLKTKDDLNVIGASVDATNSLTAHAGRDLNIKSTTRSDSGSGQGYASSSTHIDRVAGLYVGSDGKGALIASAGHDANIIGAVIANQGGAGKPDATQGAALGAAVGAAQAATGDARGDAGSAAAPLTGTIIAAGHDVNLGTLTTSDASSWQGKPGNYGNYSRSEDVGALVYGKDSVRIHAGNDANLRAATVATQGDLTVSAANDVNLQAGQTSRSAETAITSTSKDLLKKTTTSGYDKTSVTDVVSTSLRGDTVTLAAGRDLNTQAAEIRSEGQATLAAGRDINLGTATRSTEETHT
ncbi:MAG: S-layer family protein, partial [Proteobacteria bacterium]|nr:S-layer family protein [Pseudomonadota bacterium]